MTIKDKTIEALKEFQKTLGWAVADWPDQFRRNVKFQIHPATEYQIMKEFDETFFQFSMVRRCGMALGFDFESDLSVPEGEVRMTFYVTTAKAIHEGTSRPAGNL